VGILASSPMLTDTRKTPLPNPATLDQIFNFLEVDDYLLQGTKRANITTIDGQLTVAFETTDAQSAELIQRTTISTTDPCTPLSKTFDAARIIAQGAVGIKLVTIDGQKTILRLYDLDPLESR
jgi:hypothetical protein